MKQKISAKKHEKGQGLVEYTLLFVLIAIPLIAVLTPLGPQIKVVMTNIMTSYTGGATVEDGVLIIPNISPSLTPISTSPASPTPAPVWTTCANENGNCSFSGTAQVRYGANDTWITQTHTNGVSCTNAVFTDPLPGVYKSCQVYLVSSPPTTTPVPTSTPSPSPTPLPTWTTCASENGYCNFSGTAPVRYGANGAWVTQNHTDGVSCTNAVFGDPVYGTAKTCQVYK